MSGASMTTRFTKTGARILTDKEEREQKKADRRMANKMIVTNIKDFYKWQHKTAADIHEYLVVTERFTDTEADEMIKKVLGI